MKENKQKILTIGGGNGQFVLLSALRDLNGIDITSIVSMADSGGSTGRLRDELGALPPGDVLKCILALSPHRDIARELLLKRFIHDPRLKGHNAGNMLLTMLSRYTGSFPAGTQALAEILDVHANILPVTTDNVTLVVELEDGRRIFGEKAIDIPRGTRREKIRDVFLVPHRGDSITVYPPAVEAIEKAEHIFIGPGDLFTSIIPNLIFPAIQKAFKKSRASVFFMLNIMTKYGETHHFTSRDFVATLEEFLPRPVDGVVHNTTTPEKEILEKYRAQKSKFVALDVGDTFWKTRKVYACDLLDTSSGIVRHHSKKLARQIQKIIQAA